MALKSSVLSILISYHLVSSQPLPPIQLANPLALTLECTVGYVNCAISPCSTATCKNVPNAICTNNYCGACNAIFTHPSTGQQITSDMCNILSQTPSTSAPINHQIPLQLPQTPSTSAPINQKLKPIPVASPFCSIGWVYCSPAPCATTICPYYPNALCINNYCGQCTAEFYDSMNNRLTDTQCGLPPQSQTPIITTPPIIINPPPTTTTTTSTTSTTTTTTATPLGNPLYCPAGFVHCDIIPCSIASCPGFPNALCQNNYCGSCNAIFYINNVQLTTEQCNPPTTIAPVIVPTIATEPPCTQVIINCLTDPCAVSSCPAHPNAICKSNFCGGCYADWYENNNKLTHTQCNYIATPPPVITTPQVYTPSGPFCSAGWVYCSPSPCHTSACPGKRNAICHNNYCGKCNAIWTDSNNNIYSSAQCGLPETANPTGKPTANPTNRPTFNPTKRPTNNPTKRPTFNPTKRPTNRPTFNPTIRPTGNPTPKPTNNPVIIPTPRPTTNPVIIPTLRPTGNPTVKPTGNPTVKPTTNPTTRPTLNPVIRPTVKPTLNPVIIPTNRPTTNPITSKPTGNPTTRPTMTLNPIKAPTANPIVITTTPVTVIAPILNTLTTQPVNPIVTPPNNPIVTPPNVPIVTPPVVVSTTSTPTSNPTTCTPISSACTVGGDVCCLGGVAECLFDNPLDATIGRCCVKHRKRGCTVDSDCCRYGIDGICTSGKCKRDRSVVIAAAERVNNKLDNWEIVKDKNGNDFMTISTKNAIFIGLVFLAIVLIVPFSYWYYNKFVVKKIKKNVRREVLNGLEIVSNENNDFVDSDSQNKYVD